LKSPAARPIWISSEQPFKTPENTMKKSLQSSTHSDGTDFVALHHQGDDESDE
jgi:hypothetical protein